MSADNVAVIKGVYDAFAAGDVSGVLGRMSPDIVWNEAENFPYADGNPYQGPEAVAAGVYARCIGEWDGLGVAMDDLIDGGDAGRCRRVRREPFARRSAAPDVDVLYGSAGQVASTARASSARPNGLASRCNER